MTSVPGTPSIRNNDHNLEERNRLITNLSRRWDLQLRLPEPGESPLKRMEKRESATSVEALQTKCVFQITFLCLKDKGTYKGALFETIRTFELNAAALCQGWGHNPYSSSNTISKSGKNPSLSSLTSIQRVELLECLYRHVNPAFELARPNLTSIKVAKGIPSAVSGETRDLIRAPGFDGQLESNHKKFDDSPIAFNLKVPKNIKRPSSCDYENDSFKRPRMPPTDDDFSHSFIQPVVDLAVNSHSKSKWPPASTATEALSTVSYPSLSVDESTYSATESFRSNVSGVFSRKAPSESFYSHASSQTAVDISMLEREANAHGGIPIIESQSTCFGSIHDYEEVIAGAVTETIHKDEEVKSVEERTALVQECFRKRLQNTFPEFPISLKAAPFCVRYEITRVCLNAKVPILTSVSNLSRLRKYNDLWAFLREHPSLKDKPFPEQSPRDAWEACFDDYQSGFNGVVLSGNLKFSEAPSDKLFDFHLKPLKLDTSHRLGRRFGSDRILEIILPSLTDSKASNMLAGADRRGGKFVSKWLSNEVHELLGRKWKSFFTKNIRGKKRVDITATEEADNAKVFQLYLFAIDGIDFRTSKTMPSKDEKSDRHTKMTVNAMLNWLIPLQTNMEQLFLKLFSRISLGLSKTYATVDVKPSHIHYKNDLMSDDNKEVMNDGCGQISLAMAKDVAEYLGLTYIPSAFQARFGGAKGLWVVELRNSSERWIEVYPSQCKWNRNPHTLDPVDKERDHRTFEVVAWSKPLKAAALNLQLLPLLEDRGKSPRQMRDAIANLLKDRLAKEIAEQRKAMDSLESFRKWVSNSRSRLEDRLKHGEVTYKAALPSTLEEKLNLLLDAGFDPKKLHYLKLLAWKAITTKCGYLKDKLNVTVGRSTYAFIAVDFSGTLEPDEVHLGFSNSFKDEYSDWEDIMLDGEDILVARSPAHFVSDIQKVKAVWKRELKGLKDVAVFSSKGDFPLAQKLSGGDYDGDTAWICWEPTLVQNFQNAEVPECPDLVKMEFISKDKTTYEALMQQTAGDPTSLFLEKSFEFSLQDNLLGICTIFKEEYCYTVNSVRRYEAMFLSTLLSALVDQAKQGLTFTRENLEAIKRTVVKTRTTTPAYKGNTFPRKKMDHIIDYLKFVVAENTIESTLTGFHNSLQDAQYWDHDIVLYAQWAKQQAKLSDDWGSLMKKLKSDIDNVNKEWKEAFSGRRDDYNEPDFGEFNPILKSTYEKYQAISPDPLNPLSRTLLPKCFPEDYSYWSLLKASVTFESYHISNFVWWMAAKQLAFLKATALAKNGSGGSSNSGVPGIGAFNVVIPKMYAMLKPDATYVNHIKSGEHEPSSWEVRAESEVGDLAEIDDDW